MVELQKQWHSLEYSDEHVDEKNIGNEQEYHHHSRWYPPTRDAVGTFVATGVDFAGINFPIEHEIGLVL